MKYDPRVEQAATYIEKNFAKIELIEDVALALKINYHTLRRIFARDMQMSMKQYLIKIQCSQAKKLLQAKKHKILAISNNVGFKDEKYFCRLFKQVQQINPREWSIANEIVG